MRIEREERREDREGDGADARPEKLARERASGKRARDVVYEGRGADVEKAVRRRHDRRKKSGEDDAGQERMGVGLEEYRRCFVGVGQLGRDGQLAPRRIFRLAG